MYKHWPVLLIMCILGNRVAAQSITITQLATDIGAPFASVTGHLQSRGFAVSGNGTFNGVATIRYQKKWTDGIENIACFAADTARKIPAGITYTYNKKGYTAGLVAELKRSSFLLKQTTTDAKRNIQTYQDGRYEATITTYNDANAFTSITVRLRNTRQAR